MKTETPHHDDPLGALALHLDLTDADRVALDRALEGGPPATGLRLRAMHVELRRPLPPAALALGRWELIGVGLQLQRWAAPPMPGQAESPWRWTAAAFALVRLDGALRVLVVEPEGGVHELVAYVPRPTADPSVLFRGHLAAGVLEVGPGCGRWPRYWPGGSAGPTAADVWKIQVRGDHASIGADAGTVTLRGLHVDVSDHGSLDVRVDDPWTRWGSDNRVEITLDSALRLGDPRPHVMLNLGGSGAVASWAALSGWYR